MKVSAIFDFLNQCYPTETAMDFDNVGLLAGDPQMEIRGVLVALDCNLHTVAAAKENDCNLIVTHHPVIFEGVKNVLAQSTVYELVRAGISVISMHTNLDVATGGVNDCLCRQIGLQDVCSFTAKDGYILRRGVIGECSPEELARLLKEKLGGNVRFSDGGKPIRKVLICSGSGGDYLFEAPGAGCDALVTADVKHHLFVAAADMGISLFDAGHFSTEDVVVDPLVSVISRHFMDLRVISYHEKSIKFA